LIAQHSPIDNIVRIQFSSLVTHGKECIKRRLWNTWKHVRYGLFELCIPQELANETYSNARVQFLRGKPGNIGFNDNGWCRRLMVLVWMMVFRILLWVGACLVVDFTVMVITSSIWSRYMGLMCLYI
jgi:hypothetical protein